MGRRAKPLPILHPPGRNYACRDCPGRCCTSWGIPVTPDERGRILTDSIARDRLGSRGTAILKAGILPMQERDGNLACVFLDEDMLCSLHRRHGHEFLPAPCQAFPFGFSENEHQQPVALLSRYCPSIRDNYGEPVETIISAKLKQAGGAAPMAEKMGLRSGRTLPRAQYVAVVEEWLRLLRASEDGPSALCRIYDFTDALDEALPPERRPGDQEIRQIIASTEVSCEPLEAGRLGLSGRVMVSHLLGGICYPTRVMLAHRMTPITWWEKLRSWGNRLVWLLGVGKVQLLFVKSPVHVGRVRSVAAFLRGPLGKLVTEYLCEVLDRRQGMQKQTYLSRVIADLTLMTVLISHYARAAASAEGLTQAAERHVKEGIGIAELLFSHQSDAGQSVVLHQLRLNLMSNRADLRKLLAAEI
jgi:lysine-N-methylase